MQQGRVIDEWRWGSGSFAFAGQPAVDHPAAFRWHAPSKKNRPSWCLFPFQMATVLTLRTAWIADILLQASVRDVQRHAVGNVVAETRRDLVFGATARLSDLSMPLKGEVRRSPEPSARPLAAADSEEQQICTTCLIAESVGFWKDDGLLIFPSVEHTSVWEGVGEEGRLDLASRRETAKPSCQSRTNSNCCDRAVAQAAHTRTTGVKDPQALRKYRKTESN